MTHTDCRPGACFSEVGGLKHQEWLRDARSMTMIQNMAAVVKTLVAVPFLFYDQLLFRKMWSGAGPRGAHPEANESH